MSQAAENFGFAANENHDESFQLVSLFKELKLDDNNMTYKNNSLSSIESEVETETETLTSSILTDDEIDSDNAAIELSNTAQRFRALGKIIHFMRKRFLSGKGYNSLSLDEMLEQTKQTGISNEIKKWLKRDGLPNNKRIVSDGLHYQFKPTFKLKSSHDLIKLLKERDRKGIGGVFMEEIRDSLPNYREVLKECKGSIFIIKRSLDRKRIVYYVDPNANQMSDFEVQAMWRTLGLEDIEEVNEPLDEEFYR